MNLAYETKQAFASHNNVIHRKSKYFLRDYKKGKILSDLESRIHTPYAYLFVKRFPYSR